MAASVPLQKVTITFSFRSLRVFCRYDTVTFFEQSALHKVLKTNKEFAPFFNAPSVDNHREVGKYKTQNRKHGSTEKPWHSFCTNQKEDGPHNLDKNANSDSVKVFEHTAVFPMHLLNSNVCDWDLETSGIRQHRKGRERGWVHLRARRVYHAAGYSRKMAVISEMIKLRLPHIDLQSIASIQNGNVR